MTVKCTCEDIIQNMPEGVCFVDRARRITLWNKAAERITGYAASEITGSSCSDNILVHVDEEGRNLCLNGCPLAKAIEQGEITEAEVFLHHRQGYRLPVKVCVMPLRDGSGAIVGRAEPFSDNSVHLSRQHKASMSTSLSKACRNDPEQ
jgi:PAS domain S-box-containing protein